MKKILTYILSITMITFFTMSIWSPISAASAAQETAQVYLDGRKLSFEVQPQIINGRTLVPLRAIFEEMGAAVVWNDSTQTVVAKKGDIVVNMAIGSLRPTINGTAVTIDQPAIIVNDRTLAPLRFVAEAFGGTVNWDLATMTAEISTRTGGSVPLLHEDDILIMNDMKNNDILRAIRGKVFQADIYYMASGYAELICFSPTGNDYFILCSTMDEQSRIRAEYGTYKIEDGFLITTTQMLLESVNGHYEAATGSTGSRFQLTDYDLLMSEVNIVSEFNFDMFMYSLYGQSNSYGFYYCGKGYYDFSHNLSYSEVKKEYAEYFYIFGK